MCRGQFWPLFLSLLFSLFFFLNDISRKACVCDLCLYVGGEAGKWRSHACVRGEPPAWRHDRKANEKLTSDWLADKAACRIIISWIIDARTYTSKSVLAERSSLPPSGTQSSWRLTSSRRLSSSQHTTGHVWPVKAVWEDWTIPVTQLELIYYITASQQCDSWTDSGTPCIFYIWCLIRSPATPWRLQSELIRTLHL